MDQSKRKETIKDPVRRKEHDQNVVKYAVKIGTAYFGDKDRTHELEPGKKFEQSLVNEGAPKKK